MKIAVTISDVGAAVHMGGVVSHETALINIPDENIPDILKQYFTNIEKAKKRQNMVNYQDVMFSLFKEG